jgi:flagellar biosynthetic protein FlhB
VADDSGEKSHDPTDHRREEFHKQGRFARSRDLGSLAAMAAAIAALLGLREEISRAIDLLFARTHGDLTALVRGDGSLVWRTAWAALAAVVMPAAIAAALGGIVAGVAQTGIRFDTDMLDFKPERLNPLPRLGEMFSPKKAATETLMALLRVGVVGYVAYSTLLAEVPAFLTLTFASPVVATRDLLAAVLRMVLRILGALAIISVADYAQSRFFLEREMRMSLKELKEEMRSQEGDPKAKGRMRGRQRALARSRMLGDVKKADVIVTNPTHVAVALRYRDGDPAPMVIAKGHDEVALHIRREARRHGIPILESRALARALDAEVKIGKPIPGAHFAAVAHVLAFVFRLRGRRPAGGTRRA